MQGGLFPAHASADLAGFEKTRQAYRFGIAIYSSIIKASSSPRPTLPYFSPLASCAQIGRNNATIIQISARAPPASCAAHEASERSEGE